MTPACGVSTLTSMVLVFRQVERHCPASHALFTLCTRTAFSAGIVACTFSLSCLGGDSVFLGLRRGMVRSPRHAPRQRWHGESAFGSRQFLGDAHIFVRASGRHWAHPLSGGTGRDATLAARADLLRMLILSETSSLSPGSHTAVARRPRKIRAEFGAATVRLRSGTGEDAILRLGCEL